MAFEHLAKSLLKETKLEGTNGVNRASVLTDLAAAGFSRQELFFKYQELYETSEEEATKRQILDSMSKIHGLMTPEEVGKVAPVFQLQVIGDNVRVNAMLCPPPPPPSVSGLETTIDIRGTSGEVNISGDAA